MFTLDLLRYSNFYPQMIFGCHVVVDPGPVWVTVLAVERASDYSKRSNDASCRSQESAVQGIADLGALPAVGHYRSLTSRSRAGAGVGVAVEPVVAAGRRSGRFLVRI